jgi:hypothetical protein
VHGLAARAGVRLNESTVRPMDANLVKVTGAAEPSGIKIITIPEIKGRTYNKSKKSRKIRNSRNNPTRKPQYNLKVKKRDLA